MTAQLPESHRCLAGAAELDGKPLCEVCFAPIDNAAKAKKLEYITLPELEAILWLGDEIEAIMPNGGKVKIVLKRPDPD